MSISRQRNKTNLPEWAKLLVNRYCRRLPGTIDFRLDPRLRGRLSVAEVVEEIESQLRQQVFGHRMTDRWDLLVWLRRATFSLLDAIHREYLGPRCDTSLQPALLRLDCLPPVNVQELATALAGPSGAAGSSLPLVALQEAFNRLCPADREILALRHFEQLSRDEVATVLNLSICRASAFYLVAVRRLRRELNRQGRFLASRAFRMVQPAAV